MGKVCSVNLLAHRQMVHFMRSVLSAHPPVEWPELLMRMEERAYDCPNMLEAIAAFRLSRQMAVDNGVQKQ